MQLGKMRRSENVVVRYAGKDWPLGSPEAKLFFEDMYRRQYSEENARGPRTRRKPPKQTP